MFADPSRSHTSVLLASRGAHMVRREVRGQEALEELVAAGWSEEESGGLWRNLRLDWVRSWDQSSRTAVLLSRVQHAGRTASVRLDPFLPKRHFFSLSARVGVM